MKIITLNTIEDLDLNSFAKKLLVADNLSFILSDSNEFYKVYQTQDGWMYDIYDLEDVLPFIIEESISELDLEDVDIVDGGVFETEQFNFESSYQALKFIFLK